MSAPSFEAVFDAEFAYVRRSLRRLGVREADVEDLCQDVFLLIYRSLDRYDPSRPIRPWLFAFAFRVASNYRRAMRNWKEEPASDPPEQAAAGDPESRVAQRQKTDRVLEALASLSMEKRGILIMFDIDDFPAPEIASALDVPVNTVYSRVRQARQELKRSLKRLEARGGEV
ncbi:MAG: sigma-70 family RNA polymerase sigma factor [Myxococcota bacterium]